MYYYPYLISFFLCLIFNVLNGQNTSKTSSNLVTNYSFESLNPSVDESTLTHQIDVLKGWSSPDNREPLLYGTTSAGYIHDPNGASWNFKARTGKHVAGINVKGVDYYGNEDREYIQGTLNQPLQIGKQYQFSFWVHYHCEGANNIGIAFLPNRIKIDKKGVIDLKPATYQKEVTPYNTSETWTKVSGSFVAYQPFNHFIIGNFFSNEVTEGENGRYNHYLAYIDDISVKMVLTEEQEIVKIDSLEAEKWTANAEAIKDIPIIESKINDPIESRQFLAIPDITFISGGTQLSEVAMTSIKVIENDLRENPDLKIRIIGHASSEGNEAANMKFSRQRSNKVKAYLVKQGIPERQLIIEALGETQPIADNFTSIGRQQNRRVEIERFFSLN